MPNYDYRCQDCTENFTVERSMNESSSASCAHCGSEKVSRIWNVYIRAGGVTKDPKPSVGSKPGGTSCCGNSCASC